MQTTARTEMRMHKLKRMKHRRAHRRGAREGRHKIHTQTPPVLNLKPGKTGTHKKTNTTKMQQNQPKPSPGAEGLPVGVMGWRCSLCDLSSYAAQVCSLCENLSCSLIICTLS